MTTDVREEVKKRYGAIAESQGSCCGGGAGVSNAETMSKLVGYSDDDLASLPQGANLGLGCGNPVALAGLKEGETVLDLGSGGGVDCFLAAKRVGPTGRVIGVDMTPSMLESARRNAEAGGFTNVEFREGHIESIPVEDNSVDVVISNCVINLSPDKPQVFREIFRVLKPGGRIHVSDIVLRGALPESIASDARMYTACVAGALLKDDYLDAITAAGLGAVTVEQETTYPLSELCEDPTVKATMESLKNIPREDFEKAANMVASVKVTAVKPTGGGCC